MYTEVWLVKFKLKLAGTSGEMPGSTGLSVLPVVLPAINTNVQYRKASRSVLPAKYLVVPVRPVLPVQLPGYFR